MYICGDWCHLVVVLFCFVCFPPILMKYLRIYGRVNKACCYCLHLATGLPNLRIVFPVKLKILPLLRFLRRILDLKSPKHVNRIELIIYRSFNLV